MNIQIRKMNLLYRCLNSSLKIDWSRYDCPPCKHFKTPDHVLLKNLTWYNPYETVSKLLIQKKQNLNYLIFKPNSPCEWYLLTSAECLEIRFILLWIQPIIFIHFTNLWNETCSKRILISWLTHVYCLFPIKVTKHCNKTSFK